MPARDRASAKARRPGGTDRRRGAAPERGRSVGPRPSARRSGRPAPDSRPASTGEGLVVGDVPLLARVAGALIVLAGLAGGIALAPTYLVVGGAAIGLANGAAGTLAGLVVPVAHVAVGSTLLRGAVPKFGLAYAGVAGALAAGQLLIELYRGISSTSRPGVEVLAGNLVLTSGIEPGPGWVLSLVALGATLVSGVVAGLAWGRTVMEDGGALDPVRSGLAGAAVLLGVGTVLALSLPPADVPDRVVADPVTGMETVVTQEGPQGLLERPELALLGGLLLAGAVVLCSVIVPSLRPRLAVVGGLLAIAATVLSAGIGGLADAASPDLAWTLPGAGLLAAGVGYAALTVMAWRLRRGSALR